jgi:hypothetical protein
VDRRPSLTEIRDERLRDGGAANGKCWRH